MADEHRAVAWRCDHPQTCSAHLDDMPILIKHTLRQHDAYADLQIFIDTGRGLTELCFFVDTPEHICELFDEVKADPWSWMTLTAL